MSDGTVPTETSANSRLGRRRFLAKLGATGVAGLAGCGGDGDDGTSTRSQTGTQSADGGGRWPRTAGREPSTPTETPTLAEPEEYVAVDPVGAIDGTRPRVFVTQADFDRAAELVESDQYVRSWYNWVQRAAQKYDEDRQIRGVALGGSRKNTAQMTVFAFMYRLTGQERFADAAWAFAEDVAGRNRWFEQVAPFDLNAAETTAGMAVAYDWLYDYWTEDQRATLREAIVDNALTNGIDAIESGGGWVNGHASNWTTVCTGGLVQGALAIADDAEGDTARTVDEAVSLSMQSLRGDFSDSHGGPVSAIGEHGAWPEGPIYWGYMSRYLTFYLASGQNTLNVGLTDSLNDEATSQLERIPDILDTDGMRALCEFPPQISGPSGILGYNESPSGVKLNAPQMHWFAKQYDVPEWGGFQRRTVGMGNPITPRNRTPTDMEGFEPTGVMGGFNDRGVVQILWYDPEYVAPFDGLAREYVDRDVVVGSMRDAWDRDQLWLGFVADRNGNPHGQVDVGSFCLDADGTRWALDFGQPSRGAGRRASGYDYSAQGHNTLVIAPEITPHQWTEPGGEIARHDVNEDAVYTVVDISSVYAGRDRGVRSVNRGFALPAGRSRALVQDEITGTAEKDVWWFMHTRAAIETDGNEATLTREGETLRAAVHAPEDAEFVAMDTDPLDGSPKDDTSAIPDDVRKLAVNLEAVVEPTITVELVPGSAGDVSDSIPRVPLEDWSLDTLTAD